MTAAWEKNPFHKTWSGETEGRSEQDAVWVGAQVERNVTSWCGKATVKKSKDKGIDRP